MSKTNFPHPVLGLSNDYNKTSEISLEWNVADSGTNKDGMIFWKDLRYNLRVPTNYQLRDRDVISLVNASKK